eukprot:TRINITY_DN5915_c3_g1_i1.p1 TRINITY_DN5915_c3_g1~~TRINITY_DN5915_c3_g1_i1.p1  ORF type:complete len:949 (+),score=354.75 TRINITY_DN5915_c3_g1_i1:80-2926(+)
MAVPQDALQDVAAKLHSGFQQAHNLEVQAQLVAWLQEMGKDPTFNSCLAVIASTPDSGLAAEVRQLAALQLKRNIVGGFGGAGLPQGALQLVRSGLLQGLGDPHDGVRRAASSAIAAAVRTSRLEGWAGLLRELVERAKQPAARPGAVTCIRDICEDATVEVLGAEQGSVSQVIFRELVQLIAQESDPRVVCCCLEAVGTLAETPPFPGGRWPIAVACSAMLDDGSLMDALGRAAQLGCALPPNDPMNPRVRQAVLSMFKALLLRYYHDLQDIGALGSMLQHVFAAAAEQQKGHEDVALTACEFWGVLAQNEEAARELAATPGMLPQLIELLLSRMVYSEMELAMLADDETRDDLLVNVQRRGRRRRRPREERDGEGEEEDDEAVEQWTVRKAAALALDNFASRLGPTILAPPGCAEGWLLAQLQSRLQSPHWQIQEAATLALGAIAVGCGSGLDPHGPALVQLLLGRIEDGAEREHHYLVRAISCWAASRLQEYIISHPQRAQYFDRYLSLLLRRMVDDYRKVQECAVSAFSCLVEGATMQITQAQYIMLISHSFASCLARVGRGYTTRNLAILLDAVGLVIWAAREDMDCPQCREQIFDPLWHGMLPNTPDDSPALPHLLICMQRHVEGFGPRFAGYLPQVVPRLFAMISSYWQQLAAHSQGVAKESPDPVAAAMGTKALTYMVNHLPREMQAVCAQPIPGLGLVLPAAALQAVAKAQAGVDTVLVDNSVVLLTAMLKRYPGEMVDLVLPQVPQVLLLAQRDELRCIQPILFCSELISALQAAPRPDAAPQACTAIGAALVQLLQGHDESFTPTVQHCAMVLAKIGLVAPQVMSEGLASYFQPVCHQLVFAPDTPLKLEAWQGLAAALRANFSVLQDPVAVKALAIAMAEVTWYPEVLRELFAALLQELRRAAGGAWPQVRQCVPPHFNPEIMALVDDTWVAGVPP